MTADAGVELLSREDAAILALEAGPIAGHFCKLFILDPPDPSRAGPGCTLDALCARVASRLPRMPRMRQVLLPLPGGRGWCWAGCPGFDITRQVVGYRGTEVISRDRLLEIVADRMAERLPRDRPLWSMELVEPLAEGRVALLVRLHHAWADGATAMHATAAVLADDGLPDGAPAPRAARSGEQAAGLARSAGRAAGATVSIARAPHRWPPLGRELRRLPRVLLRDLRPGSEQSPFAGTVGHDRRVAVAAVRLDDMRTAAHAAGPGVTVNDVLLAMVAGATRERMLRRGREPTTLRCKVPVSMHRPEGGDDGNRDSFMIVELPVGDSDPMRRLRQINRATTDQKRHHDAEAIYALFADLGMIAPPLERVARRAVSTAREFAVTVSNVRGPDHPPTILGSKVRELYSVTEIARDHGLRVSAVSLAGQLTIGLCADPRVIDHLDELAGGFERALREVLPAA